MVLTVELPDHIAQLLGERAHLEREILETFLAEAYRSKKLSRKQVADVLGLAYWDMEDFLTKRHAKRPYTLADLEIDRLIAEESERRTDAVDRGDLRTTDGPAAMKKLRRSLLK